LPFLELKTQMPLGVRGQRKNHHAGRISVQPMHKKGCWKNLLHTRQQAVGQVVPFSGHRKQASWFVYSQKLVILVKDI
jgi:hypothetical protein